MQDAAFLLPQTQYGPLHCQSPYDIYLLLKSSDFLSHSMDPERAYATEGQEETEELPTKEDMKLELLLRKYESINPSREFRCFVREDILLGTSSPLDPGHHTLPSTRPLLSRRSIRADRSGISVKDFNYYPHFQDPQIREKVCETVRSFFEDEVLGDYAGGRDCTFPSSLLPPLLSSFPLNVFHVLPLATLALACALIHSSCLLTSRYFRYSPRRPAFPPSDHRFQPLQPIFRPTLIHIRRITRYPPPCPLTHSIFLLFFYHNIPCRR